MFKLDLEGADEWEITNICGITEKARESRKNIYFCFIDYTKTFDCVDQNKLWKILKDMRVPDHLTCMLRNLHTVNAKGNQSWIFIGRTDAEDPILWPPDAKYWLIGKDPAAGKD